MSFCEQMLGGPGPVVLTMGIIADGVPLVRDGLTVRAPKPLVITATTFTWQTDDLELLIAGTGAMNITLPPASDVTSWVPSTAQFRRITKFNTSANGIVLTPQAGCTINGGAAATAMNPIPGTAVTPSLTVIMPSVRVFRANATTFYVLGG